MNNLLSCVSTLQNERKIQLEEFPSLLSEHLLIPNNLLTDESVDSLVKIMNCNLLLREVDLTNNQLSCEGAKELSKFVASAKCRLQKLVLSLNRIGDDGCAAFCQALGSNRALAHLDLSSNQLTSAACTALARLIKTSRTVKTLNLACNRLGEDGGEKLLEGLKYNDVMMRLDIRLTGKSNLKTVRT